MKKSKLLPVLVIGAGLSLSSVAFGHEKGEKEENVSSSDIPSAVQQAADKQVKGQKIVRWEKEGANFEAVVEKNGKETGYTFDANGKFVGKHNESTEHKEKGEKY